jgi:hypothetical protein
MVTVLLIGRAAVVLARYKSIQRLGDPGVKTRPIAGSRNLEVVLPENVLDFHLGVDAAIGDRHEYLAPRHFVWSTALHCADKFYVNANVVLMGDRPRQPAQTAVLPHGAPVGPSTKTEVVPIPIEKPVPYDLDVIKLTRRHHHQGRRTRIPVSGIYVYWYVADSLSANPSGSDRMWSMARTSSPPACWNAGLTSHSLPPAIPGRRNEAYARVKKLIAAAVPEFQIDSRQAKVASSQKP